MAFTDLSFRAKMVRGGRPLLRENLAETDHPPFKNAVFQSIFTRSALAVTPSEKSSINTNRKSTTRFPINLRWTVYTLPLMQTRINDLERPWMTLNGGIALILRYFIEFHSFAGRLRRMQWLKIDQGPQNIVFQLYVAKNDLCSGRMVSLRQLSFLFKIRRNNWVYSYFAVVWF